MSIGLWDHSWMSGNQHRSWPDVIIYTFCSGFAQAYHINPKHEDNLLNSSDTIMVLKFYSTSPGTCMSKNCWVSDKQGKNLTRYHVYPKYLDTSTPYHTCSCTCSKIWTSTIYHLMSCLKIAGWVTNSVDPDETPHCVVSHLGLHCLLRPAVQIHMVNIALHCLRRSENAGWVTNSVDPDETPHCVVSHLGLHCLLRPAVQIHMVNIALHCLRRSENLRNKLAFCLSESMMTAWKYLYNL